MQTKRWKDAKKLAKNPEKVLTSCTTRAIIHSVKGRYKTEPRTERGNDHGKSNCHLQMP
nr:MAG TPA: hypothetical protein [Caudoviricetes sp.]